jgi:PAS domain S-box-containing protein
MAKTSDMKKTKAELVKELEKLRRQVSRLQKQVDECKALQTPTQEKLLLHALLDNTSDHVYFKDAESRFLRSSRSQTERFGLDDPLDIVGKTDFDFFSEEHARQAYEDEQIIMRTGEPMLGLEEKETWPDGRVTWVSTNKMLLRDEAGNIIGTFGFSHDITARKQVELALERRSARLQTAAEVSTAASSILDLDDLIQRVVELARERFGLYYAGLFLVDEDGKWAVLKAGTGEAGRKMVEQGHRLAVGSKSMIGACIADRQACVALDLDAATVRHDNPLLPETRSELALPLIARDKVVGALTVQSAQEAAFTQEDIAVLQTMANQLANAIVNARLYEALAQEQYLMGALLDSTPDHIYFKDAESRFIRVSRSQSERFGLADPAHVVGKTDFDFFTKEHARPAYEDEQRIIHTGEPVLGLEEKETWPDGSVSWVSTSKMPLRDETGKIIGTFGISSDITSSKQAELALRDSEERLRTILNSMPSAVIIIDAETHNIIDANVAALALAGAEREQVVGSVCHRFICPAEQGRCPITDLGQTVDNSERVLLNAQGEHVPVLKTVISVTLDDRPCLIESFVDISSRKQAEEALGRRAMQLQAVAEVAREATAILEVGELLQRTVDLVSEGFGFYHTGIFMLDELRQYAVLRAASSEGGQRMLERGHQLSVGRMGVVGYVAEANEPRIALDVGDDAVFFDNPDLPETRSEMALPLAVRGEVIGVLDVQSTESAAFTEEDVAVLRVLADQLAIAIENARLVQRTEEQVHELNLLYGQFSAETWARLAAAGQALGYVYDRVDVSPADGSPPPAHSMALERGAVIELASSETAGATLAVPLRVRDQVIGSLGVEAGDGREWSPEELSLVEAVGEQVAQAIEGARLFVEAQKTALSMEALYQTSRAISSALEEEALVRAVLEAVQRTLNCDYVLLSTVDEDRGGIGLRHGIWQGEFDIYPEWREMSQYSLNGHDIVPDVYRTGRTETILGWDERFNRELWDRFELDRYLRVFMPIRLREQVIGVVEVAYDKRQKDSVGGDEVQILAAFMDQAAVALENVRLFDQVQRRAQREHQIYEIANRLRRSPDISSILQTAVDELGQALRVDRALVRLVVRPSEGHPGDQGAAGREEPPEG